MITNNIQDFEIDKISNPTRLLVSGKITLGHYKALQLPFLVMALFLSSMVGFQTFCLVLLFIGNYYLYSAPPIRFKRVPFFSKFVVAVNSLLAALCGYELIFKSLLGFPPLIVWFLILVLVFPIQFIDIKDYAGDKVVGIRTLPTLLGLPRAKRIIGGFFVAAYTLGAMIFPFGIVTVVVVGAGFLQYYWITRETYQEARVFQTYLLTLLGVILYIGYFGSDLIWR